MKIKKLQVCNQCNGSGKIDNKECNVCFGYKKFYFYDNNFIYFEKEINKIRIFIQEFKNVVNIFVNGFLVISVILTLFILFKMINNVQFDPHNLLINLQLISLDNLILWILVFLNMYLYYRLNVSLFSKDFNLKFLKNKDKFIKYNIADNLNKETSIILDKAWLYANNKKTLPVTVWHILFILLNDKDIMLVLARLGVGAKILQKTIDKNLGDLVKIGNSNELNDDVKEVLLNAFFHSVERDSSNIAEIDLLSALVLSSEPISNFFYDFDIDKDKIDNVITWIRINRELTDRYGRFRHKSLFKPKSGMNRSYTAIATPILDSFSQDLTKMAIHGSLPLSVARDNEINDIVTTIESDHSSIILVGPPGVGKTNIIEGLANRMMAEEIPELFQDKRLVSISIPFLISGASGTGALEERFLTILNETAVSSNIILVIENIHQLTGITSEGTEGVDLSEVLASEIRNRNVIIIGTSNNKDYTKYLEGKSLGENLKKIVIEEPDKNQTIKIMEAHVGILENKHKVYFTYNSLEKIYDLTDRYIPDQYLPRKALNIMDEVAIQVNSIKKKDKLVRSSDVAALLSRKTNIPLTEVTSEESSKLMNLENEIHERIIGQDEAVKFVAAALRRARAELRDKKRPIVNLLFLGPTGVGKTELAKTVAEKYFSDEENMIRFDMSEYQTQVTLARLIGSAQTGKPGLLTEAVRHKPFALLLLDEIEKAHPDILNIFLQVMEDGRLTDALGRTVDFTNLILVATSNAGTSYIQDQIKKGINVDDFKDELIKEKIRNIFRPEFLNRFDGVAVFRPLTREEIFKIAGLLLNKVKKRLEEKGIFFEITDEAQRELAEAGFDPIFGARPLRRVIQENVDNALAKFLLSGKIGRRDTVVYNTGGRLTIKKAKGF